MFLEKRQITSLLPLAIYHALVKCYHSIIENDYPSPGFRGASERGGIMDGKRVKRESRGWMDGTVYAPYLRSAVNELKGRRGGVGRGEHKQTSCHISQQQINSTPRAASV